MERLHKSTEFKGAKDDIDLDTDTLWGLHTIESCYIRFTLAERNIESLKPKQYESYALALVTEKELVFVLISNIKDAVTVVDMIRLFKKGRKYKVSFSKIVDITVNRESTSQLDDGEPHQTIKIMLPSGLGGVIDRIQYFPISHVLTNHVT